MPGYYIQYKNYLPGKFHSPENYTSKFLPEIKIKNTPNDTFDWHNKFWADYTLNSTIQKNSTPVYKNGSHPTSHEISPKKQNNEIIPGKGKGNTDGSPIVSAQPEKILEKKQPASNRYENLILAFLLGAGTILLFATLKNKYKLNPFTVARKYRESEEIAGIADRIDRCADRFANANNYEIETAAHKAAKEIRKCNTLENAKNLEISFHDKYLIPACTPEPQLVSKHNILSVDAGYTNPTLERYIVTTSGGYYQNSAGSLSWTMGEPVTETFSDGSNYLTQGFQQSHLSVVSVVDEVKEMGRNFTVYPNPFSTVINIKSDSADPIRVELIDLQGNSMYTQTFGDGEGQLNFSNLPEEIYLLRVYDKDGNQVKVFKIQKTD